MQYGNTIRIGIIGSGSIASSVHIPLLSCISGVKISYIADIIPPHCWTGSARKITINDTISTMPDCDIVLLAMPVGARAKYIAEFSSRNIPIFSEKPFAPDIQSHKNYVSLSKKITCNYMRTFFSSIQQLKNIISSCTFGPLKEVIITEGGIIGATGKSALHYQLNHALSGGGILIESGCHTLSQLTFLLNSHNILVKDANVTKLNSFDVDVSTNLVAKSKKDKIKIKYELSKTKPITTKSIYVFENANISFDHTDPQSLLSVSYANTTFDINPSKEFATTFYQSFYLKWNDFIKKIILNEDLDITSETSFNTTRLIEDIYKFSK